MLLRGTRNSVEVNKFLFRSEISVKVIPETNNTIALLNASARISEVPISCSGYILSENQVIGSNGPANNVIIHISGGCAAAYWANTGNRTHRDWLPALSGKTVPDNILLSCIKWEGETLNCSANCETPTISKTAGTTVCLANNQTVTLSATNCAGTVTWFKDGTQIATGSTITRNDAGNYTATCTANGCTSASSPAIAVTQTAGCGSSTGCVVNKVRLQFRIPGDCCMERLVGAKIQGSNNGSNWTDLYTFTANGTTNWQEFNFTNSIAYSSIRFLASNTGWGELVELEFYNGATKLSGIPFGTDNYGFAFDNSNTTMWHAQAAAGPQNIAGLNLTGCGSTCTTPAAPTISKTAGTTVCLANNQTVTLSATNCAGTVTWFKDGTQIATGSTLTRNDAGNYTATCTANGCTSTSSPAIAVTQTGGCGQVLGTTSGTYSKTTGGREFTYNRTPELELQFNSDGTITDATAGLSFNGSTNKLGDKNVFYMIGYKVFENSDGTYNKLQNLYLPDGVYTIRQFVCDAGAIPNLEAFRGKLSGWNNGVTTSNSRLSEVFLSIKTTNASQGLSITPNWLKVSRNLLYPSNGQQKNWASINKFFCMVYQNRGSIASDYHLLGVNTDMEYGNPDAQPNTWNTVKWGNSNYVTNDQLRDYGDSWIRRSGDSKRFLLTDEIPENSQGNDPTIYDRMYHFYKGAFDRLQATRGITNKRETGLYGPYGGDDFSKLLVPDLLKGDRSTFEKSLTTHVHKIFDPATGSWAGDAGYYTSGQIDVRNINHSLYMTNNEYQIPYELLYVNERVKVGTKTWQGQDKEADWIVFSWHALEPSAGLVDQNGNRIGIEYGSTGEIIPFPNGEMLSRHNLQIPAPWDEYVTMGFWSTLVGKGIAMWSSPGSRFGSDPTKLNWWSDQQIFWTPNGGSRQNYVSGQNGAAVTDENGLINRLWTCPGDAAYAGNEAAWKIRNRTSTLSYSSYTSSRGSFTAKAGIAGLHLNGFGVLNQNLFVVKDAYDAKKGLALVGTGSEGTVLIYYNGFLSPHEFEDNVTINGTNIGRVYVRQTVVKTL
jgi:hypothetical protein